ncbi:hypothetical protein ACQPZZ_13510 [Microbispora sp. CA-135349]|uniref:hypothetical protein n=1 Tax=Microbispora sp. CA-135349 TaxID=3239953 RepID=UPI003D91A718
MFKLSDSTDFRRSAVGAALLISPVFQLTATVVDPGTWGDPREAVSYGDNPPLAQLQSALYHWSWVLLPLALLGLMHLTRKRGTVLGHIAGLFAVLGFINLSALLMGDAVEWWFGQHYPAEQAEKLFDEVFNLPGVIFAFQMPWVFLGPIGLILMMIALTRAGFVRWWLPVAGAVAWLSPYVTDYGPLAFVWGGGNIVVLGYLGLKVLRMSNAQWASYYPSADPGVTTPDSYANTTA